MKLLRETGVGIILKKISKVKSDPIVTTKAKQLCQRLKANYSLYKGTDSQKEGLNPATSRLPEEAQTSSTEELFVGERFEDSKTWKDVYDSCELIERRRSLKLGARFKERSDQERLAQHNAVMLPAAPREQKPSLHTSSKAAASSGGYQQGKSIRQTLGMSVSKPSKLPFGTKKRNSLTSEIALLSKSTKRMKTIQTSSGSILRIPRK